MRAADFFADDDDARYDAILANPPFSVEVGDPAVLARHTLAAGRTRVASDILFIEAALARLRPGGRLVTVLPYTVLSGAPQAGLRDWVDQVAVREAVVSLPEGVFRPFGGTPTRACIVALRKRPAAIRPTLVAVVTEPGFDARRQTFRRTEPDELAGLRMHLRGAPYARARRVLDARWVPEAALREDGIAPGVPTFRVADRAPPVRGLEAPAGPVTRIDFADVDKATGEVVSGRAEAEAADAPGFEEGDLLFGRMRPELNNVALATAPRPGLPVRLVGSSEWVRLRPAREPAFTLLALRSRFARAQLVTSGQTRPRVRAGDVLALRLPDPGPEARAALDAALSETYEARRRLRWKLEALEALYDRFGRGELDADALVAEVRALG